MTVSISKLFLFSSWIVVEKYCQRYLRACHYPSLNGCLKATMHIELCNYYVSSWLCSDYSRGSANDFAEELWEKIHDETQALTGSLDERIGFPYKDESINPDAYARAFFEEFHKIAMREIRKISSKSTKKL